MLVGPVFTDLFVKISDARSKRGIMVNGSSLSTACGDGAAEFEQDD
jgi:hypothetical protein